MGGNTGKAKPPFSDGPPFETIGSRGYGEIRKGDERFARIVCASCGTTMGMALHGAGGPAYCAECWENLDDGEDGDRGGGGNENNGGSAAGVGDGCHMGEGAAHEGCDRADGDDAPAEPDGSGGVDGASGGNGCDGGSGEQVRRMRALMRTLEGGESGPPTRRQVLEGMVLDGGGGAWKDREAAEWCLDNILAGIVYEPEAGRLSMIDGE